MKRFSRYLGAVLALLLAVVALRYALTDRQDSVPALVCLDVGEGSATLIRTSAGDLLIDTGPEDAQAALCERLHQLGVRSLALLILTHPDEDHIGGADGILQGFPVQEIWTNGEATESDSYRALLRAAEAVPIRVVCRNARATVGEAELCVLSPEADSLDTGNENGLVLRLTIGTTRILIMGDSGQSTEKRLLEQNGAEGLRAELLLAGHHGSNTASDSAFLQAVAPEQIVISCGKGNAYGHPDGRALERMRAVCDRIRRTDVEGEIRIALS